MKKGFTILELLVASLLLGMLVTILTMIFNQSSIAWRTGVAGVADLDATRDDIAQLRDEADNVFIHGQKVCRVTGLWNNDGTLRPRACTTDKTQDAGAGDQTYHLVVLGNELSGSTKGKDMETVAVGKSPSERQVKTYTVGVTSWGPDREKDTYDDITTWPDELE